MRVTRITIDANLGLIDLKTGPGGDGDYVLLPLEISEALQRYVTFAGEPCEAELPTEAPYSGMRESAEEARSGGAEEEGTPIQMYNYDGTPNGIIIMPPGITVTPGVYKYPYSGVTYERSPELQREFDKYLAADADDSPAGTPLHKDDNGVFIPDECDGNCGAHPVVRPGRADDLYTRAPGEDEPTKERHTTQPAIPNPVTVIALEHSRGYRLTCPALPHWKADINQYDLYKVPGIVKEKITEIGGMNVEDLTITIAVKEMN